MTKSQDAFRTISEVASDLDLPQHVLRFWETRFTQISPLKRGGGRRYYRPDDVELLKGIRHLLYGEGYTIKGVQRILREQGVKFVMSASNGVMPTLPKGVAGVSSDDSSMEDEDYGSETMTQAGVMNAHVGEEGGHLELEAEDLSAVAAAMETQLAENDYETVQGDPDALPEGVLPDDAPTAQQSQSSGPFRIMDRLRGNEKIVVPTNEESGLSKDEVRSLQATLFELLECKRMLDQAR
ncbi:MerR family transcriptional regulator [Flexibacterium corallicola]|uniref:MerR family transcriptional regulator n=1 Tax=Flexibacterium corallicola TaxID=3037259 RepID=UPI00286ED5BC|nr:MerR family transcriptional regulator [Pseudovibrio sp. M1P-2-3]